MCRLAAVAMALCALTPGARAQDPALHLDACPRFIFAGPNSTTDIPQPANVNANFLSFKDGTSLEVALVTDTSETAQHKRAKFRLVDAKAPKILKEVVLDEIDLRGAPMRLMEDGAQSYPAFLGDRFYGIAFPIAAVRIADGKLLLAYRPGLTVQPDTWYETRQAVAGINFEQYLLSRRPAPPAIHVNYNSWWTSPAPYYTEKDILDLIETFRAKLFEPHQAAFDTFCIDMGWSNPKSLWEIDPKLFPDGFRRIEAAAGAIKCSLGLWISPGSLYPTALDNAWAKNNGYEAAKNYLCLGGAKYRAAFRDRLVEMVTKYRIRHIKLDGYVMQCEAADHGHDTGVYSADAIAQGIIDAAMAVHQAAPDTWLEPTGFGFNPSPWWLLYFNSVIGCFGDDAPRGRVPAPVYRESYTTARDYYNLQGAWWNPCPAWGQEVLGIIHQTPDPFLNDAVMTILRGHLFLPLYVNPKFMREDDWRDLRLVVDWARANEGVLARTTPVLPESWRDGMCPKITHDAPMPREPYGYVHWRATSGVIGLRNPWLARATVNLALDETLGVSKETADMQACSIYPQHRLYARDLRYGSQLAVPLAPYETLLLMVKTPDVPGTALPDAHEILDGHLQVNITETSARKLEFEGESQGPDWTSLVGDAASALDVNAAGDLETDAPEATLLVLLEKNVGPVSGRVEATLNGRPVEPRLACDSFAGWAATGRSPAEYWQFHEVPLPPGNSRVTVHITATDPEAVVSAWVLAKTKPGGGLFYPREIYLDSAPLLAPVTAAAVESAPIRRPRPIEKINGIYLDALEPIAATQGYGTLQKNQSVWEKPIVIGSRRYFRGLGTHAPARIVYALDGRYATFSAVIGADAATVPTVTFEVRVDGRKQFESDLMRREDPPEQVTVDVRGAKTLELVVGDGGNGFEGDHADWANATLIR